MPAARERPGACASAAAIIPVRHVNVDVADCIAGLVIWIVRARRAPDRRSQNKVRNAEVC